MLTRLESASRNFSIGCCSQQNELLKGAMVSKHCMPSDQTIIVSMHPGSKSFGAATQGKRGHNVGQCDMWVLAQGILLTLKAMRPSRPTRCGRFWQVLSTPAQSERIWRGSRGASTRSSANCILSCRIPHCKLSFNTPGFITAAL